MKFDIKYIVSHTINIPDNLDIEIIQIMVEEIVDEMHFKFKNAGMKSELKKIIRKKLDNS